jgi:hypothetical protein
VAEPYQELPVEKRERIVSALLAWAESQPDRGKTVLRFLDGSALRPQDLLDESPQPLLESEEPAATERAQPDEGPSRRWAHMLNLVAVSMAYGEDLDEILCDLRGDAIARPG